MSSNKEKKKIINISAQCHDTAIWCNNFLLSKFVFISLIVSDKKFRDQGDSPTGKKMLEIVWYFLNYGWFGLGFLGYANNKRSQEVF